MSPREVVPLQPVLDDVLAGVEIAAGLRSRSEVTQLVAAALIAGEHGLLTRAAAMAQTTSDRQLVEIAVAHLAGDVQRVRDLARDHLADQPDSVLVAWITARSVSGGMPRPAQPRTPPPNPLGFRP